MQNEGEEEEEEEGKEEEKEKRDKSESIYCISGSKACTKNHSAAFRTGWLNLMLHTALSTLPSTLFRASQWDNGQSRWDVNEQWAMTSTMPILYSCWGLSPVHQYLLCQRTNFFQLVSLFSYLHPTPFSCPHSTALFRLLLRASLFLLLQTTRSLVRSISHSLFFSFRCV